MKLGSLGKKFAFYVGIVLVWHLVYAANIWPQNVFPSPFSVAQTLWYGAEDGTLWIGIGTSLWRLTAGFVIAVAGGISLG
ncbi:MAG: ABC transporter permease, partial [Candidatus Nitrosotenuis sp.]